MNAIFDFICEKKYIGIVLIVVIIMIIVIIKKIAIDQKNHIR